MPTKMKRAAKLAAVNRKIVQLSAELETLQFMQDHLERELGPVAGPKDIASVKRHDEKRAAEKRR